MAKAWFLLVVAGLFEIGWPIGFKLTEQAAFRILGWVVAVVCMGLSGWLLWLALLSVFVGAGYWLHPVVLRARRQWLARKHAQQLAREQSADYAWQQINPQLQARPAQLSAVYVWLRRHRLGLRLVNAGPRLQGLLRGLYGRDPQTEQTLVQLRQSLTTLHSQVEQQPHKPASALRPLNPVQEREFP